jgi:hypothetical protein
VGTDETDSDTRRWRIRRIIPEILLIVSVLFISPLTMARIGQHLPLGFANPELTLVVPFFVLVPSIAYFVLLPLIPGSSASRKSGKVKLRTFAGPIAYLLALPLYTLGALKAAESMTPAHDWDIYDIAGVFYVYIIPVHSAAVLCLTMYFGRPWSAGTNPIRILLAGLLLIFSLVAVMILVVYYAT